MADQTENQNRSHNDSKFVDRPLEPKLPTYSESGVDLTLLRWMLSLTHKQRLEVLQNMADFTAKVKHARITTPVREDPADSTEA